ncbi:hypothetical protein PAPYR_3791 [Paratrimastix pyriformis]|uniref:UNC93-like protein MFSD11 n=1 Tax=Paratrimastix pyriformis TaxID=342808 RepID=A0ABQ8UR92_9EUKA|nr:hypothetical protein PAPYR_3791 [Paratrimastix pyriformis]
MAIIYFVFAVMALISPPITKRMGPRLGIFIGSIPYVLFCAADASANQVLILVASILYGASAAVLWSGQGKYLIALSPTSAQLGLYTGVFFMFFSGGNVVGNSIMVRAIHPTAHPPHPPAQHRLQPMASMLRPSFGTSIILHHPRAPWRHPPRQTVVRGQLKNDMLSFIILAVVGAVGCMCFVLLPPLAPPPPAPGKSHKYAALSPAASISSASTPARPTADLAPALGQAPAAGILRDRTVPQPIPTQPQSGAGSPSLPLHPDPPRPADTAGIVLTELAVPGAPQSPQSPQPEPPEAQPQQPPPPPPEAQPPPQPQPEPQPQPQPQQEPPPAPPAASPSLEEGGPAGVQVPVPEVPPAVPQAITPPPPPYVQHEPSLFVAPAPSPSSVSSDMPLLAARSPSMGSTPSITPVGSPVPLTRGPSHLHESSLAPEDTGTPLADADLPGVPPPPAAPSAPASRTRRCLVGLGDFFLPVVRIVVTPAYLLLLPTLVLLGLTSSFWSGVLPPKAPVEHQSTLFIVRGVVYVVTSLVIGRLSDRTGRMFICTLMHLAALVGTSIGYVGAKLTVPSVAMLYAAFVFFGFFEGCLNTQVFSIIGFIYPKQSDVGVSAYNAIRGFVAGIFFLLGTSIPLDVHFIVFQAVCVCALGALFWLHYGVHPLDQQSQEAREKKKKSRTEIPLVTMTSVSITPSPRPDDLSPTMKGSSIPSPPPEIVQA